MAGIIDLHCHILPGMDDGAQNVVESRALLRESRRKGVRGFIFTPHFYPESMELDEFIRQRERAWKEIASFLEDEKIPYRYGAEIKYSTKLASIHLKELAFSGTGYLLLELNTDYEPYDVPRLIRHIKAEGYTPILAHIERYPYLEKDPYRLYEYVKAGALTQVNAGWILKDKKAGKKLRMYYDWNLVHLLASDTHSIPERRPNLAEAYARLPEDMAETFRKNGESIFLGNKVEVKPPVEPRKFLGHWR